MACAFAQIYFHKKKAAVQSIPDGMHMHIYGQVQLWLLKYWQVNQPLHKHKVVSTPVYVPATKPSNVFNQLQGLDWFLYM